MTTGNELLEERQRRRQAGDPRLSSEGLKIFLRMAKGDLADEFQAALDEDVAADPILGDRDLSDDT